MPRPAPVMIISFRDMGRPLCFQRLYGMGNRACRSLHGG